MLNCAVLMGRLTADPVLKTTTSGKEVCSFQIAVDKTVNGERKADFITIVAWEGSAVFVEKYFRKGSMIAIQGSIQTRPYEDKHGNKRTAFEIVAREINFCGDKKETSQAPTTMSAPAMPSESADSGLNGYYSNATAADFEEIGCDYDEY
jgi:single-strand DNA-binding protein